MKSTIESLQDVYAALGGSLEDTYEDIAGGAPVGDYVTIPDAVEAVSKKASAGGGSDDSNLFMVEVDINAEMTGGTVATPSADIQSAITAGKIIFVVLNIANSMVQTGTVQRQGNTVIFNAVLGLKYYKDASKVELNIIDVQFDIRYEEITTCNYGQYILTPLPVVAAANNGQVLTVVSGKWDKADVPKELPAVTATDNGDVLKVVDGAWAKASS